MEFKIFNNQIAFFSKKIGKRFNSKVLLHKLTGQPFFMGWFISPSYSSFFIAGVAFYLIHTQKANRFNLFILGLSFILSMVSGFTQAKGFMANPSVESRFVAMGIIGFFFFLFYLLVTDRLKLRQKSIYLTLGGLTYPLYLIHAVAGKAIIDFLKGYVPGSVSVICVTVLVIFFSYLIHIGIEKKVSKPVKVFLLSAMNKLLIKKHRIFGVRRN